MNQYLDKFYGFASKGLGSDEEEFESQENGVNLPETEFSRVLRKIKETEEAKTEAKTKDVEVKKAEAEAKEGGAKTCPKCFAALPFSEECPECGP